MLTMEQINHLIKTEFDALMREAGIPYDKHAKRFGDACGLYTARGITFRLLPKNAHGAKRIRRLRVLCEDCGTWISYGKLSSHLKTHSLTVRPMDRKTIAAEQGETNDNH